jgi:hypothetical protein
LVPVSVVSIGTSKVRVKLAVSGTATTGDTWVGIMAVEVTRADGVAETEWGRTVWKDHLTGSPSGVPASDRAVLLISTV